jgi:prophage tail gpP-like protein
MTPFLPFALMLDSVGLLYGFDAVDLDADLFTPINAGLVEGPAQQLGMPVPWALLSRANIATASIGPAPVFTGTAVVKTKNKRSGKLTVDLACTAKILVDCAPPVSFSLPGGTLASIAKMLCTSLGVLTAPGASGSVPRKDAIATGKTEPVWSTLTELAKQTTPPAHVWCDAMGLIHIESMAPYYARPPVDRLHCLPAPWAAANNILDYTLRDDAGDRYSHITVHGEGAQRALQGNAATGILNVPVIGTAVDPELVARKVYRPLVLEDGAARNLAQAQAKAMREMMLRRIQGIKIEVDLSGWTTTAGVPWAPAQMVLVNIAEDGILGPYFVVGRRFTLSKTDGRKTRLTLIEPGVL